MTDLRDIIMDKKGLVYFIIFIILITVGIGIGQMTLHFMFSSVGITIISLICFIGVVYWYENNQNNNLIKF
jgi:hypothetical protein